jgi:hypothetical protein
MLGHVIGVTASAPLGLYCLVCVYEAGIVPAKSHNSPDTVFGVRLGILLVCLG